MWRRPCNASRVPKDADQFFNVIENQQADLPPVIAMGGAERVYVDDALQTIRKKALAGGIADFNHDRVSARDKNVAEIVSLANTLPVMSKRRLVEVRDANSIREHDHEALTAYLSKPAPETVVVLLFAELDLRDKLTKIVDKGAFMCRFEHPKDRDMPQHVQRRARKHGLSLDRDAIDALAATVGADLTLLERAIEKLALVAGDDKAVTSEMVATHVADTHLEDAFAFVRALAKGERAPALRALGALQAAREEPLRLVGLIAWQLRQIARARALLDQGSTAQQVGTEMTLFGDRQQATIAAARRFEGKAHAQRLTRVAETDQALKGLSGGRTPPWLLMSRLVLDLCPPVAPSESDGGARARSPRR